MVLSYYAMVMMSPGEKAASIISTTLIPIIGVIYVVVKAQRYDHNGK